MISKLNLVTQLRNPKLLLFLILKLWGTPNVQLKIRKFRVINSYSLQLICSSLNLVIFVLKLMLFAF